MVRCQSQISAVSHITISMLQLFCTSLQSAFVGTVLNNIAFLQSFCLLPFLDHLWVGQDKPYHISPKDFKCNHCLRCKGMPFLSYCSRRLLVHNSPATPIPWQVCFWKPFWSIPKSNSVPKMCWAYANTSLCQDHEQSALSFSSWCMCTLVFCPSSPFKLSKGTPYPAFTFRIWSIG